MHRRSDKTLDDLARMVNPHIRGWINYFGHFYRSALYWTLNRVDAVLVR
jgi:RNA-directed DNA polymerase